MARIRTIAVSMFLVLQALLDASDASDASADWPRWRGPAGDAHARDEGFAKNWSETAPKLAWMAEGLGAGYASVSITGGRVFTMGNAGVESAIAIDASDGRVVWTSPIGDRKSEHGGYEGPRSTPALDGGFVYVVSSHGAIACLKQDKGEKVWSREFSEWGGRMMSGWGYSESPLVDGDHVLCTPGGADAMIVCLDKKTGKDVWRAKVPEFSRRGKDGAAYSSIAVSNAAGVKQYVQLIGRGVVGIHAKTGKFLWGYDKVANTTANIPTPVVFGNFVFASTAYGTGSALLEIARSGGGVAVKERYFLPHSTLQNKHGGMVFADGYIYCGTGDGSGLPICIDVARGKVAWGGDQRGPGRGECAVIWVDGHILYRFQDGVVALVEASPKKYEVVGSFKPAYQRGNSWAHPVIAGGKLYLREQDKLMCYALESSGAE